LELYVLSGDHVARMCRNIPENPSLWTPEQLQRFFELSRVDYVVLGTFTENHIFFQMKISTTFEIMEQGDVEGTIPLHLSSLIAQKIRNRLDVKETKIISVEQIFHGNIALLQQYATGVRAYRDGKYKEAERALQLALKHEP